MTAIVTITVLYLKQLKTDIKATINLITSKIDCKDSYYVNLDQIEEMKRTGLVSFGSHTFHHLELNRMSYDHQFREITI